jgi:hypothetical protein
MGWVTQAVEGLRAGESVQVRPRGHSMRPRINDGYLVTIAPCDPATIEKGDIVLVRLRGNWLLHLVTALNGERVQIGNNHGRINGWAGRRSILGRVTDVRSSGG